ncbi:hypothetical protein GVX82_03195 [Patescibacteria group bacterium]|jgi:DNA polymerase III delta subunit|nr:hypothetical protein [Patescibacteria group bacterium]
MLYAFYGSDTEAARARGSELTEKLAAKQPDASLIRLDDETFEVARLPELAGGQGLFVEKFLVVLDRVGGQSAETKAAVLEYLPHLAESQNIIVLIEGALDAASKKKVEQHAARASEFSANAGKREEFNVFALGDALVARDKKKVWALYREALMRGKPVEEIHGILFWQMKGALIAAHTTSAEEAGMKPYPYQKAKAALKKFSPEELESLTWSLLQVTHEARRGTWDAEVALERWVLRV